MCEGEKKITNLNLTFGLYKHLILSNLIGKLFLSLTLRVYRLMFIFHRLGHTSELYILSMVTNFLIILTKKM